MNSSLKLQARGLMIGLALQFLLGMWSTLYDPIPQHSTASDAWHYAMTHIPVMLHVILGTLLVLGAIVLVARCFRAGSQSDRIASSVGLGAVLLAWGAGDHYVVSQANSSSFAMAFFFIVAMWAYGMMMSSHEAPAR